MSVRLLGRLQLGAVFPRLADATQMLIAASAQSLAQAQVELPQIDADAGALEVDLGIVQTSIQGLAQTIALGPAAIVAGAMAAVSSGQMLAGLTATGPQIVTSLAAGMAELTAKAASMSARLGNLSVKKAAIQASVSGLKLAASFGAELGAILVKGDARLYVYEGSLRSLGAAIDAHIKGVGVDGMNLDAQVWVPLIVTDDAGTSASLQLLFPTP
ncbi:hypothetical protein LZC95_50225 [Pendulispora brunnea]|uniref:Uncharacterized protein n=1 Tax=Pendulispora brunnea TaxID=2905690 RepID=A0ABZ2KB52_9BACT